MHFGNNFSSKVSACCLNTVPLVSISSQSLIMHLAIEDLLVGDEAEQFLWELWYRHH